VDVKALEESIKQSQAERKDEVAVATEPTLAPAPALAPAPGVTTEEPAPAVSPVAEPGIEAAKAPEPGEPAATPAPTSIPETAATSGSLDYGITRKGDNLWTVASKIKPSEQVTIYQVMMALQQSNPDAFVKGNIHRLKANHALRIEDPRLLTAMSKEQASKRYEEQTHDWQEYLSSVGAQVPRQAIVAGDAGTKPDETSSVPSGELTLSPPSGEGEGVGSGQSDKLAKKQNTEQLRKQVQKAVADAETERRKNSELASRVEDLEKELKRLENLVTVKDSDLAALQSKLEEVQKKRTPAAQAQPVPAEITEAKPATLPEPMKPVEQTKPAPTEIVAAAPQEQATPPVVEAVKPEEPKPVEQAPTEVTPKAAPAVTAVKPVEQKGSGFIANILGMLSGLGMYLMIGGIVLLLLLILLFVWIRRRNKVYFQESILKGGATTTDSQLNSTTASAPVSSQSSLMTGGESSFLSDFAISGVSAIQAEDSEVDPLTEADVFMAYGRYEAAEERLNEAIKHDPNRGELRVKLLELFSTTKNKKAFETAAEDYYAALGGQTGSNPLWQKVVSMGADIAPNNPLFKGGSGGGSFTSTSNLNDSKVMDIGLDTGAFRKSDFAAPAAPAKPAASKGSESLDFNLDFEDKTVIPPAKTAKTSGDENTEAGLDFNLDFGGTTKPGSKSSTTVASGDGGLDFNLDMSEDEEPTATDIKFDTDEEVTGELDFDLESPGPGRAGRASNKSTMEMDLDASDAINLDMPTGGDEVGTKLDLARAYIDMGDPDGARSILDEVMSEGSDGQKQEARQLMSQIG
jgi:pilus assembly protein FimV